MHKSLPEHLTLFAYRIFGISLMPFLVAHLLWRGLRQPAYWRHWSERFVGLGMQLMSQREQFFFGPPTDNQASDSAATKIMWLHAVSVGETRAAAPLITRWLAADPRHRVVLTHTTPTGRETGRELFAQWIQGAQPRLIQRYLPYDYPWANALFLSWARPSVGVLMETEIWPGLIAQATGRGIPMALINARLSPRSAKRLHRFRWLSRPAVAALAGIGAQTQRDADGFIRVLARGSDAVGKRKARAPEIQITGNTKFDVALPHDQVERGAAWRKTWPHAQVWLAASTRDDEESLLLAQWAAARARGELLGALLVIVPRHPQRFDRVAKMIESHGLNFARRSTWQDSAATAHARPPELVTHDTHVLLGDSMGEMFAYLAASDLVLIGGSLPALGGQNPIEACAVGRPVFFGPNMHNFHQIAQALLAAGAGELIKSPQDWIQRGQLLLADASAWAARADLARAFAQTHRGATERTESLLLTLTAGR